MLTENYQNQFMYTAKMKCTLLRQRRSPTRHFGGSQLFVTGAVYVLC